MDFLNIEDKTVVVTGGASGIGKAISEVLQSQGANVIIADLNVETKKERGFFFVKTDVTNNDSVKEMIETISKEFSQVDVLVNNAGINLPRLLVDFYSDEAQYEVDEESFDKMNNVNVKGVVFTTQAIVKDMIQKDVEGTIINISSESGMEGSVGQSIYTATKGAINALTRSWGKELGKKGIRVVGVAGGINEATGLTTDSYNEALAYTRNISVEDLGGGYEKSIPLGRVGKLEEIGNLVAFLSSNKSDYITGTTLNITGGKSRG